MAVYADKYPKAVNMKNKSLCGIVLLILVMTVFSGCSSPPPPAPAPLPPPPETIIVQSPPETLMPLTVGMLTRLFDSNEQMINEMGRYQLVLLGRVFLERNYTQSTNRLEQGGRVTFLDTHIRDEITIQDQTEGVALGVEIINNEIILSVCFEREDQYTNCQLTFSALIGDPEAYFYMKYSPNLRGGSGDERGILQYGGPEYRLKFTGDKSPYLLLKLSQRDMDRVNSSTASGRRV